MTHAAHNGNPRILFVDDEADVLDGLKRMLRPMRSEWSMEFAGGGQAALELLKKSPCDVIVSDMRMPAMDGARLLTEVMERYPAIIRLVLSGHSDQEMVMRTASVAHQFLSKPCDGEILKLAIVRALQLRNSMNDTALQSVIARVRSLPSLPVPYAEMLRELRSPNCNFKRIAEIIEHDVGMSAKILQLVNSAFFGLGRTISNLGQAINLLGLDTIRGLVLSTEVFSQLDVKDYERFEMADLPAHSLTVGLFAKEIARIETNDAKIMDESFVAGLLHDIGKLVFMTQLPELYLETLKFAKEAGSPVIDAELKVIGATHAAVGAYLLGLWGLPDGVVEAVAFHHNPSDCAAKAFMPLTAVHAADKIALCGVVHVADMIEHGMRNGDRALGVPAIDDAYVAKIGLQSRCLSWMEACRNLEREKTS